MMKADASPELAAVAFECMVEVATIEERRCSLVNEPLCALKGPAAPDAGCRVTSKRGIANECESGPGGRAHYGVELELTHQLGHARPPGNVGTIRESFDHSEVGVLPICAELDKPRPLRANHHHCQVVLVWKASRDVRI
jgi:hypothetical protein